MRFSKTKKPNFAVVSILLFIILTGIFVFAIPEHKSPTSYSPIQSKRGKESLFIKALTDKCPKGWPSRLSPGEIPYLKIDTNIIKIPGGWDDKNSELRNKFDCMLPPYYPAGVTADLGVVKHLWITDKMPNLSGLTEANQYGDVKYFVQLILPSGGIPEGHGPKIDGLWVNFYGLKTLKLASGETVYVELDDNGITPPDSRLNALLEKYTVNGSLGYPELDIKKYKSGEVEKDIAKTFLGDINTLAPNEKSKVEEFNKILNAIEAK